MSGLIPEQLKTVLERNAQALQLRPAIGKGTGKDTRSPPGGNDMRDRGRHLEADSGRL